MLIYPLRYALRNKLFTHSRLKLKLSHVNKTWKNNNNQTHKSLIRQYKQIKAIPTYFLLFFWHFLEFYDFLIILIIKPIRVGWLGLTQTCPNPGLYSLDQQARGQDPNPDKRLPKAN